MSRDTAMAQRGRGVPTREKREMEGLQGHIMIKVTYFQKIYGFLVQVGVASFIRYPTVPEPLPITSFAVGLPYSVNSN